MVLPDSSHPIRILFFQQNPVYGATEYHLKILAEHCSRDGYEVAVVYPDVPELEIFSAIPGVSGLAVPIKYVSRNLMGSVFRIAKVIGKFRPHIVQVNDPSPIGIIAAKLARVPKIVLMHHTPEFRFQYNWKNWKGQLASKVAFQFADCFIFSTPFGERIAKQLDRIPAKKSRMIPYGIDVEEFSGELEENREGWREQVRNELGIDANAKVIASVGRLDEEKNYSDFIRAAKIVCDHHDEIIFVVAGEGGLRPLLEEQIKKEHLTKRFLLPGFQTPITRFLSAVDIFVMPSICEGMCYAVLEASFMGLPVIASSVGGLRYSVLDGKTGVLIPKNNPQAIAEKILWFIKHPEISEEMGQKGKF